MHIIRLDIDRKNSAEHLQIGPLGSGLNAVYAPVNAGGESMARFVRSILFRGYPTDAPNSDDYPDSVDGSLQWVDASGHVRMMSYAGGSPLTPSKYIHSPLHPSERPIHADDRDQIRGLGNIFWEGDDQDGRWDDLRGDILGMIFCSPLGSVSPEKLWWAASRLGVHTSSRTEPDEGYHRLKAEENELLERLRSVESVDHDRAWWSIERDRIAAEINHLQHANLHPALVHTQDSTPNHPLRERLVSIQIEIARLRTSLQEAIVNEANAKLDMQRGEAYKSASYFTNVSLERPTQSNSVGNGRFDYTAERARIQNRIDALLAEQAAVEIELRNAPAAAGTSHEPIKRWDDTQLRQQYAHAEEMIRRWDRRSQSHRRLAELQSHLRTRSPFRRTTEGSLIPSVEKFLRELTSGAVRQLPPWAIEASYLSAHEASGDYHFTSSQGYRGEYYDRAVPSPNTRQRKLVDLAIRLAIAQASVPRVGRIPLLLDDAVTGFRGEALEQVLHVLATFSRDGRQLLLSTSDEYTARRIAAHGGTVSRMQEIMRYARANYVMDGQLDLGLHPSLESSPMLGSNELRPLRVVGMDTASGLGFGELNRQLAGLANEQAVHSWWYPERHMSPARTQEPMVRPAAAKRFYLYTDSQVHEAPGVDSEFVQRLHTVGIHRVGDLLRTPAAKLGNTIRIDPEMIEHVQRVAELMCGTPQLRAFDAQVLVGCGITRSSSLRDLPASDLINRVESFLSSPTGRDLTQRASSFEVSRIHSWISDMKRNLRGHSSYDRARTSLREPRTYEPRQPRTYEPRNFETRSFERGPRIARSQSRSQVRQPREERARRYESDRVPMPTTQSGTSTSTRQSSGSKSASVSTSVASSSGSHWKFYLDIDSPVVDAPSIGPKMAERLNALNIQTVGDLIASVPATVASQLAERSVSSETIEQWQQQALLVCRIPNLRGHDAQLLVGAGSTTAEQVAGSDVHVLFESVTRFANTKSGVRVLRGSTAPDLAEVSDWIQWAQNCRAVRAA